MIMHYIHLPFTVFIYCCMLPFPCFAEESNKQIIFVMKYEVSSYETDKHCLRQIIILQEGSIFICIYHHHIPNVKVN